MPESFTAKAMECLNPLYRYGLRLTHDEDQAADLVQETFARFLGGHKPASSTESIRPLLFRILHNCFVDQWRAARRRPILLSLDSVDESGMLENRNYFADTRTRDALISEGFSREVQEALNALPIPQREALWLREIEDFSYQEIAEILLVSVGTIRSRLSRARGNLAQSLERVARDRGLLGRQTRDQEGASQ